MTASNNVIIDIYATHSPYSYIMCVCGTVCHESQRGQTHSCGWTIGRPIDDLIING